MATFRSREIAVGESVFHLQKTAAIPVPLRKPDPPATLDLTAVVNSLYDRGLYDRKLRYHLPCPAPVGPQDAKWAEEVAATVKKAQLG